MKRTIKKPKVSVLMSVFNGEKYLREAVDSMLNQTFKDFEFLIINDGSTDKTEEILKSFDDSRIRVYNNRENIGLSKSLNIGLKMAKGDYTARQDADDISMPERLKKQVDFLNAHPDYAVVGTFATVSNEDSGEVRLWKKPTENTDMREFLKTSNCIVHGSAMIRMSFLHNVGFYYEPMEKAQDYELWLRLSKKYKMANIPDFLYLWRLNHKKLGIRYNKEQQIFVALAKIKNNFLDVDKTTTQLINSVSEHHFNSSGLNPIFKLLSLISFRRISGYNIYNIYCKLKFKNHVRKTLSDFASDKISFCAAKTDLKKILKGDFGFFV